MAAIVAGLMALGSFGVSDAATCDEIAAIQVKRSSVTTNDSVVRSEFGNTSSAEKMPKATAEDFKIIYGDNVRRSQ